MEIKEADEKRERETKEKAICETTVTNIAGNVALCVFFFLVKVKEALKVIISLEKYLKHLKRKSEN